MKPDVTIIVPMFNEQENIPSLVQTLKESLAAIPWEWEILLVNDGSRDRTLAVAQEAAQRESRVRVVSYLVNQGRGKALRAGFEKARGRFVVTTDADMSYHPKQILPMVRALQEDEELDIVVASPYAPGGEVIGVPWQRLWVSRLGNLFLRIVFPQSLHTTTGIFRAYRRDVLRYLDLASDGKEIHLEILSKALAAGFRVREVPAVLTYRQRGKSKFRFRKTAVSHLVFSMHEKPMIFFGSVGLVLVLFGFIAGAYVSWLRLTHHLRPGRPLITVVAMLVLGGIQLWSFGFIAVQIQRLRQDLFRLHRSQWKLIESQNGKQEPAYMEAGSSE